METAVTTFCGLGEPLADMFRLDLKKLKPSFGGGSTESLGNDDGKKIEGASPSEEVDGIDRKSPNNDNEDEDEDDRTSEFEEDRKEGTTRDDDNDEEDENEEDVQKMLDDLRIPDFNMSVDFDALGNGDSDGGVDYEKRIKREEIFSKRYHPSKEEKEELQKVASELGVGSSPFCLTASANALQELLFGNHSIILKKGPICSKDQDCDLIVLTGGFILAYQKVSVFNPLGSRYEACHFWTDVDYVEIAKIGTLLIQMQSGESFELYAMADGESVKDWFRIIEPVILQQILRDKKRSDLVQTFGWQYTVMRHPGFTAAVMGDMRLMGNPNNLNDLDVFNQSAPLHYAMQHIPCNAEMVEALLRLGSDPNLPDGEGRSAMYFAKRNELDDIESILQEHGGKASKLAEMELRGELFGGVEQAQKNTEIRREHEQATKDKKAAEAAAKAESAQSQMSKNMAAMIERTQKIEEMDDKARELNEQAKQYGELATQLKNKVIIYSK
jgi:hypothetical protein